MSPAEYETSASITLHIPQYWSGALVVWELLDNIWAIVWDRRELPLMELLQSERYDDEPNQLSLFDPDGPSQF